MCASFIHMRVKAIAVGVRNWQQPPALAQSARVGRSKHHRTHSLIRSVRTLNSLPFSPGGVKAICPKVTTSPRMFAISICLALRPCRTLARATQGTTPKCWVPQIRTAGVETTDEIVRTIFFVAAGHSASRLADVT